MSNSSSIALGQATPVREPAQSIAMIALGGAGNLPVPVQVPKVVPPPPKAPLIVRISDTLEPYGVLTLFGAAAIPVLAACGVIGYEAITGTTQELALRKAFLLGQMAALGIPVAFLGFNALAGMVRARFEAPKAE